MLTEGLLTPLGKTQHRLAKAIGVARTRTGEVVNGIRAIRAGTTSRCLRAGDVRAVLDEPAEQSDLERERELHAAVLDQVESLVPT